LATRAQLKELARLRLKEAEHLYQQHLYDGCIYLCGYVVELALKARICRILGIQNYPETGELGRLFKTHDFSVLKLLAGLDSEISLAKNKALFQNWSLVLNLKVEDRYKPRGTYSSVQAQQVLKSLTDKPDGVLTWLSKRW
jgi:HEPN domain-containing protein